MNPEEKQLFDYILRKALSFAKQAPDSKQKSRFLEKEYFELQRKMNE